MLTDHDESAASSTEAFLRMPLKFSEDENGQAICSVKVSRGEEVGVMMGWELPISTNLRRAGRDIVLTKF